MKLKNTSIFYQVCAVCDYMLCVFASACALVCVFVVLKFLALITGMGVLSRNFCLGGSSGEGTVRDARLVGGPGVLPRKILNFRSPETQFRAIKGSKEQLSC